MYINAYEFELTRADGDVVPVSLRLSVRGQMALKKKFNESTTDTLFGAIDDIDRFVAVMGQALDYNGNKNTIKDGIDLVDLMAENGMLGMAEKQSIITSIGAASGIFSAREKDAIDGRANAVFGAAFGSDDEGNGKNSKNDRKSR